MYHQLEDNQAGLQTMLASRFVAGIREQVHCTCLLCPSFILDSVIETETEKQGDRGRDGDCYSKVMFIRIINRWRRGTRGSHLFRRPSMNG